MDGETPQNTPQEEEIEDEAPHHCCGCNVISSAEIRYDAAYVNGRS